MNFIKKIVGKVLNEAKEEAMPSEIKSNGFYRKRLKNEHKKWSTEDKRLLRDMAKRGADCDMIASVLQRTPRAIYIRGRRLGIDVKLNEGDHSWSQEDKTPKKEEKKEVIDESEISSEIKKKYGKTHPIEEILLEKFDSPVGYKELIHRLEWEGNDLNTELYRLKEEKRVYEIDRSFFVLHYKNPRRPY